MERTTTGIISTQRATAPAMPVLVPGPKISTNSAYANRPATIEGMPVITSTKKVIDRASVPLPYSTR